MNLFYAKPDTIHGSSILIEGQEAIHISKVLRHSEGDQILVTDGKGNGYECQITNVRKNSVYLDILKTQSHSPPVPYVSLCMGIIKKRDRLEFAVEKAVELGVAKIILFEGEHSQKRNVREDRLESTVISAMKQSLRFYLSEVIVEQNISDAISKHAKNSTMIFADETVEESNQIGKEQLDKYFLIVGPEGGFSSNEREIIQKTDPEYYSLGENRLRTETAAIIMVDRFANLK